MEHTGAPRRGIIFILSAPSGAGKTTISRAALKAIDGLQASVSLDHTKATQRRGRRTRLSFRERGGIHTAARRRRTGRMGAGSSRPATARRGRPLDRAIARRPRHPARHRYPGRPPDSRRSIRSDAVTIFVLPPSFDELEGRLRKRATENEAAIAERLRRAREEAQAYPEYDYLIINADSRGFSGSTEGRRQGRALESGAAARGFRAVEELAAPPPASLPRRARRAHPAGRGVQPAGRRRS